MLVVVALLLAACHPTRPARPAITPESWRALPNVLSDSGRAMVALSGAWSTVTTPGVRIARDSAAWAALWAELTARVDPPRPAPRVADFPRQMIVLAALGSRPSLGYDFSIDSVLSGQAGLRVVATELRPGAHCGTPTMLAAPFALWVTPQVRGEPVLVVRSRTRDCPP